MKKINNTLSRCFLHPTSILIIFVLIFSCKSKDTFVDEGYSLKFYPREVRSMNVDFLAWEKININGSSIASLSAPKKLETLMDSFVLTIYTSNIDTLMKYKAIEFLRPVYTDQNTLYNIDQKLASYDESLQNILELDYRKVYSATSSKSLPKFLSIPWEYRVSGMKNITIKCNKQLFGKVAGYSLNPYFELSQKMQIINSETRRLISGLSDPLVKNIEEWISMKPMAPVSAYFKLKQSPPELPQQLRFIIELETVDGKILRDSTSLFTLKP